MEEEGEEDINNVHNNKQNVKNKTSKEVRMQLCKKITTPALLYGSEVWIITRKTECSSKIKTKQLTKDLEGPSALRQQLLPH